jgi:UPF0755 protein
MLKSTALSKTFRALFLGIALVSLMVACAGYAFLRELRRPAGSGEAPVIVTIDPGDSTSAIATKLRQNDLIRQPLLFSMLVRSQGLDGKLQAGTFRLRPDMTLSQIISALQVTAKFEEVQVTIPEGLRLEEVAEIVGGAGMDKIDDQAFLEAARDGARFKDSHILLNSLPMTATLEGFLFPDTYRFAKNATADAVINIMLERFTEQFQTFEREITVADENGDPLDVYRIVTMASIVQREAGRSDEMPKIAAVFWNRLKPEYLAETGNGRLQSDPTLQYALGKPGNWWPKLDTLTVDQIDANTDPYNTRVQPGLPPGPISNPGLAALRAAARPEASDPPLLYFVASCEQPGAHNFASSSAEFQQFEQAYLNCKP